MNLPNKLTILRIILIIPFITFMSIFLIQGKNEYETLTYYSSEVTWLYLSGIVFVVAMLTDWLDGYLARKNNQVTSFGKLFDPIADKVITTSSMIFLLLFNYTFVWLVLIFILRDILVDGSRNLAAIKKLKIEASIYGKLKTVVQSIAITILFFITPAIQNKEWLEILLLNIPLIIAGLLSIISGFLYFKNIMPYLNTK
ncbi:MAG: CDP-diacylglycerol--glycerol-3-phosphate 3-phosphatidyltransferase [Metamycoplasmataceae bacterium]